MHSDKQNDKHLNMKAFDDELRNSISGTSFPLPKALLLRGEIYRLVANGLSSRDIALQLNIDQRTDINYLIKLHRRVEDLRLIASQSNSPQSISSTYPMNFTRPPVNAEYVLHLLLRKDEREVVIGDLIEEYGNVLERFNKRRADIWFYKQVGGSLFPLFRRAVVKIGALVWLGRALRRLIS